jgi:hypothetical protein
VNENNIGDLLLESLNSRIHGLTKTKTSMLKESCVWCLTKCEHSNGVMIESLFCDRYGCYRVVWDEDSINLKDIFRAYNSDDAIEFGAEAIALLLIKEHTPYTAIERAVKGTGIDYWLGYKSNNPNILFSKTDARLELTGILEEKGTNTIKNRIKKKMKQTEASNRTFPVYISVIEFSRPKAETIMKNANN